MSSDAWRAILSVDDLTDPEIDWVLGRARELVRRGKAKNAGAGLSVGLLFLEDSLRTRVGFAEAAARIGGTPITVIGMRDGASMSNPESFGDTLRTLSGMVDVVVARTPFAQHRAEITSCLAAPFINGGDGGLAGEHPSQALIDLFAVRDDGDLSALRLGVCGDLQSRAARSTIKLFARRAPRELRLMAPPSRTPAGDLAGLAPDVLKRVDFAGLDALIMCGLPARRGDDVLDADARAPFALTGPSLAALPAQCLVYCPMPAIDEIGLDARKDNRLRMFAQSDNGVSVRAALLEGLISADW